MIKKNKRKILSIFVAIIVTASMIFGALTSGATPAYAAEFSADKSSVTDWINYLSDEDGNISTENVGRIWTDKTVSKDSISFAGGNGGQLTVGKKSQSDFLVALSAMSSTSNIVSKTDKPLDIVMVLDVSGSMRDEEVVYEYIPVYEISQNRTYYLDNGIEVSWKNEISFPIVGVIREEGWYAGDVKVTPKTSADDNNASHVQFNNRQPKGKLDKMQALKTSVKNFITETDKINQGIEDKNKKHRIGLVKFAGTSTDIIGNNFVDRGENYSQIVSELTSDVNSISDKVDGLSPGGATRADYGMDHAERALQNSRTGAQKVVIFFTDGQPTASSGFQSSVANAAITKAKALKDNKTLIYSIGIFAEAHPDDTVSAFNSYMHGVSSNYPDATSYENLGKRADNSNYYKAATNADELDQIFTDIAGEIQQSVQGSPTETQEGFESHSGYITFKDELGSYMKCDGFTDIVFDGKHFTDVSNNSEKDKDGNTVTTYKFTGKGDNNLYPNGDLSDIIITVTNYEDVAKGDLVEVKVPATLIPVRDFHIADGKMTVEENHPIRVLYNASVKEGVIDDLVEDGKVVAPALIKNPDKQFKEYLKSNKTADGKVKFFSNMWSGGDNGDTTATFEPSDTNTFYKFTEDTQLFKKTEGNNFEAVKSIKDIHISSTDEYFFNKTYYTAKQSGGDVSKHDVRSYIKITTLDNINNWMYERDGKVYIKQGTQRLLRIDDFTNTTKEENKTGTAKYRINPLWDNSMTNIVTYLGNNGVATAQVGGALSISKTAQLAEGMTGPVDKDGKSTLDDQKFTFEITADTNDGEYTSRIFTKNQDGSEKASEASKVTFQNNKATVELKNKERIEIYGLKNGAAFTVTETDQPKGFKQIKPTDNKAVTGTISEEISKAEFVNEYKAEPVKDVTSLYLGVNGTKKIEGRTFESDDEFKFVIDPSEDNPDAAQHDDYVLTLDGNTVKGQNKADLDFGKVTFNKPGKYQYRIIEYLPGGNEGDHIIPSITYDPSNYLLTINIKDDGEGKLEIDNFKIEKRSNPQSETWETIFNSPNGEAADKGYINFTNTYNVDEQAISLRGLKQLSNKELNDYGNVQFGFRIDPAGSKQIGASGDYAKDDKQPMPQNAIANEAGAYIYKNGSTGLITMPNIMFNRDNIGKEYKYVVSELQPTKNGKLDGEPIDSNAKKVGDKWTYKGITFDNTTTEITIKVETTEVNGKDVIKTTLVSSEPGPAFEGGTYEFIFKNTYNAILDSQKPVTLDGTKNITGREFTNGDSFKFNIEPLDGAPNPEKTQVTINPNNGNNSNFSFGKIDFNTSHMKGAVKQPDGTYKKDFTYKITEEKGNIGGITYDNVPVMAKVTVIDNGAGQLSASVKYTKNNSDITNAQFTNVYKSQLVFGATGGLDVSKTLKGRDMRKSDAFEFKIKGIDTENETTAKEAEDKLSETDKKFATNADAKDGKAVVMNKLGALEFTQADAGKTYSYEISETKGNLGGVVYDNSKYIVAIRVIDNLDGTMHTVTSVTKDNKTTSYDSSKDEKPEVLFENNYKAASLNFDSASMYLGKNLTGREVKDTDEFSFTIEKASFNGDKTDNAIAKMPLPEKAEITLVGEEINNVFSFGNITFTEAGVYKYDIKEVIPADKDKIKGITYDTSVLSATITVLDDGNGNLKVSQIAIPKNIFENTYKAEPINFNTKADSKFEKVLEGRQWLDTDRFAFSITAENNAPLAKDENGKDIRYAVVSKPENGNKTSFDFGTITFDKVGTYTYKVKEIEPSAENMIPGINYDDHVATLTIEVIDNKAGSLEIGKTTVDGGTFTNTYNANNVTIDTSAKASFIKELKGRNWKDGESFDFTIAPSSFNDKNDAQSLSKIPMPKTTSVNVQKPKVTNRATFNFGSITFSETGTYKYEIKEVVGKENPKDGLTYDTHSEYMTIVVGDDNQGHLTAKVTLDDKPVFENKYKTEPTSVDTDGTDGKGLFTKQLVGRDLLENESFKFTLSAVTNGAPMPEDNEGKTINTATVNKLDENNTADFGFGSITFDKPGTYVYNVVEEKAGTTENGLTYSNNKAVMTVTVVDAVKGEEQIGRLTASVKVENDLFVNTYKAAIDLGKIGANFNITKSLSGRDMQKDQFSFEIKPSDEASARVFNIPVAGKTVKSPAAKMDAKAVVSTIEGLKFSEENSNKTYGFKVKETGVAPSGYTYDKTEYTVNIKVDDLTNGKLKATVEISDGKNTTKHQFTPDTAALKAPIELAFKNAYKANSNNDPVSIEATKKLNGRPLKAEEFSFVIKDAKGSVVREGKNQANGTIDFGQAFTYNIDDLNKMVKEGLATKSVVDGKNVFKVNYTAEEVGNLSAGIVATAGNFNFYISVTDNGDGTLSAEATYPQGGMAFINTYGVGVDNIPLMVNGSKVLKADEGLLPPSIDGKYTFTMTAKEKDAPLPENVAVTNDKSGNIQFGKMVFKLDMLKDVKPAADGSRTKTFNYKVTESGQVAGITNDANKTKAFSVTLKDDGVGNLTVTPSESAKFKFTNTYAINAPEHSSVTDQIKITKKLTGRDMLAGEFKFELVDSNNKVISTGTNDAKGNIVFDHITYSKPGDFTYTVREVQGDKGGVVYDNASFIIKTTVKDNHDGTLSVTHETKSKDVVFNNTYKAQETSIVIGAAKKLVNGKLEADQFEFKLMDEAGNIIATAKNDDKGQIVFDSIKFNKPGTYKYQVAEIKGHDKNIKYDENVYNVTIEVTDNKEGNLVAKAVMDNKDGIVFVNTCEIKDVPPQNPQNPQKPEQPQKPVKPNESQTQTGDSNSIGLLAGIMAIAAGGIFLLRRKES